jgi:ABC-type nickel/cobalt efflux system permease component RcnA
MKAFFIIGPLVLAASLVLTMAETSMGLGNIGAWLRLVTSVLLTLGAALTVYAVWRMEASDKANEGSQGPVSDDENLSKEQDRSIRI